jgi:putative colanic acid biosysnthesis UDP-glucose lipid carrier transferase
MAVDRTGAMTEAGDLSLAEAAGRVERSWLKRLIDIVGAGGGLLFLAPILMFVAVLIRLESGGPSLFRQRRTGHAGAPFKIYKFRTMHVQEDGETIKQAEREDQRLTSVGAFLRRSSIDELPQLINVLKGDMSLVGPRPHAVAHDHYYASVIPQYDQRFMIRPGITGLAQVMGFRGATPDVTTMAARIDKDLQYISQWSVGLDIAILIRTVLSLPFDPTAY